MKLISLLRKYTPVSGIQSLATRLGVFGILYDDILQNGENPFDRKTFIQLYGQTGQMAEMYDKYVETVRRLAQFYAKHDIRMMVLKGYGLSKNWPDPKHRPTGDIDIYLFDKDGNEVWKRADELIVSELGIKVDDSHEHHTCFQFEGTSVENHYDIVDSKTHKDGREVDAILKGFVREDVKNGTLNRCTDIDNVYFPNANFNAIFVLRHMAQDFSSTRMNLRQILDWAYFMDKCSGEVDWKMILPLLEDVGIIKFFHLINAICVDYLEFDEAKFPTVVRDNALEKRVLDDLFNPEFKDEQPKGKVLKNIAFKVKRYWAYSWKKKLVFKYNPYIDFFYGSKMHLERWKTLGE